MVSCNDTDGAGSVHGALYLQSCDIEDESFNLNVDFYAASYFENTLTIRLQHKGLEQVHSDGVFLEIRDVSAVAENLGESLSIEIEPPIDAFLATGPSTGAGADSGLPTTTYQSPARVTLYLNETCPDSALGFADGDGTITFDAIYQPGQGKRIKGYFTLRFVDPRTRESDGNISDSAEIEGDFDFNYSNHQPEQPFI